MSLNSVNTNIGASIALQSLQLTNTQLQAAQKAISTGYRVADATDDGAAYAVAQRVRSDVGALTSSNEQLGNIKGLVTTTLSALTAVSNTLNTARGVLVKLADTSVTGNERTQYAQQYSALVASIKTAFQDAKYNSKSLVGNIGGTAGFGKVAVVRNEVGATYGIATFSGSAVVGSISSSTLTAAGTAVSAITAGGTFTKIIQTIGTQLNYYGSASNSVDSQVSYNSNKIDSLNNGLGSLVDTDLLKESAKLQALQIRQQLGTQALSLANQAPQSLLSLFK